MTREDIIIINSNSGPIKGKIARKFFHSSIHMARSKHTPHKNVGGKAPRKNLAAKAGKKIFKQLKKINGNGNASRRYRPGTKALYQIRQYQKRTDLLIRK